MFDDLLGCKYNTLDILAKQVEEKMDSCSTAREDQCLDHDDVEAPNESLSSACLKKKKKKKKKEVHTKGSKRKRMWQDNKGKVRRKTQTTTIFQEGKVDVYRFSINAKLLLFHCFTYFEFSSFITKEARNDGGETQIPMTCTSRTNSSNFTKHGVINSFTQLLMVILVT
jgi:hypothetical protein